MPEKNLADGNIIGLMKGNIIQEKKKGKKKYLVAANT